MDRKFIVGSLLLCSVVLGTTEFPCVSYLIRFSTPYRLGGVLSSKPVVGTYLGIPRGQSYRHLNGLIGVLSDETFLIGLTDYLGTDGHRSILRKWVSQIQQFNQVSKANISLKAVAWGGELKLENLEHSVVITQVNTTTGLLSEVEKKHGIVINYIENAEALLRFALPSYVSPQATFRSYDRNKILRGEDRLHLDSDVNSHVIAELREVIRRNHLEEKAVNLLQPLGEGATVSREVWMASIEKLKSETLFDGRETLLVRGKEIAYVLNVLGLDDLESTDLRIQKGWKELSDRVLERARLQQLEQLRITAVKAGHDLDPAALDELLTLREKMPRDPNFRHDAMNSLGPMSTAAQLLVATGGNCPRSFSVLRRHLIRTSLFLEKIIGSGAPIYVQDIISQFTRLAVRVYGLQAPSGLLSEGQMKALRLECQRRLEQEGPTHPIPLKPLKAMTESEWAEGLRFTLTRLGAWLRQVFDNGEEMIETFHIVPAE